MNGQNGTKPLNAEEVRQLMDYDPKTGHLTWRRRSGVGPGRDAQWNVWNGANAGKRAFTAKAANGYLVGAINSKTYYAHRVAFAIANGRWPEGFIDHINGNREDNRACNLREATVSQNRANSTRGKQNGLRGVRQVASGKWQARICHEHIGTFNCQTAARLAYAKATLAKFGDFALLAREGAHA